MICPKKTKRFTVAPNPSGVHFGGFEHIRFQSRTEVENQVMAFLGGIATASNPQVKVVLGEWGDGKSELYERFLKTQESSCNFITLFCVASSIANAMKTDHYRRMIRNEVRASVRFMTALMMAMYHDSHNQGTFQEKHAPRDGRSGEDYTQQLVSYVLRMSDSSRLLLFVDEFEELLGQGAILDVLSGIKEIVNQEYEPISSRGTSSGLLAGRVHLVLACTPDAYHRLPAEPDTGQIFGGLDRRIGRIKLHPIRKRETVSFLSELTSFYFQGVPPREDPFGNMAVFETLHRICLGNVGNLVTLHANLLLRASSIEGLAADEMCVMTVEDLEDWLSKMTVSAYGGSENSISLSKYSLALKEIEKQGSMARDAKAVFQLLVFDGRPHSCSSIQEHVPDIKSVKRVKEIISYVNSVLTRAGFPSGLIALAKLKNGLTMDDLKERLSNAFEYSKRSGDEEGFYIGYDFYRVDDLQDMLSYRIDAGTEWSLFYPLSGKETSRFFGALSNAQETTVTSQICNKMLETEPYYAMSPLLADQIFPAPVPPGLDFITDRTERLRVWRAVNSDFVKLFNEMASYIADMLGTLKHPEVKVFKRYVGEQRRNAVVVDVADEDLSVRVLLAASNPETTVHDVDFIQQEVLGGDGATHFALLLTTGGMSDEAKTRARDHGLLRDELGVERLRVVSLHPQTAKHIIAMHLTEKGSAIDTEMLSRTKSSILRNDLDFATILRDWLDMHSKLGFVVKSPMTSAGSPGDLEEALRFFANFAGEFLKPEDAFSRSLERYQKFVLYGDKAVFTPDITENTVRVLAADLATGGFLTKTGNRYCVRLSETESMIVRMLDRYKEMHLKDIRKRTVRWYKTERVLEDLYLGALEYKGLVKEQSGRYSRTNRGDLHEELNREYQKLLADAESNQSLERWGVLYISKQNDTKLITYDAFMIAVKLQYESIESSRQSNPDDDSLITRETLLVKLIDYYNDRIRPLVGSAIAEGTETLRRLLATLDSVERFLREAANKSDALLGGIAADDLSEVSELADLRGQAQTVMDVATSNLPIDECPKFMFQSDDAKRVFFNPRLYLLKAVEEKATTLDDKVSRQFQRAGTDLDELEGLRNEIMQSARTYDIASECRVSGSLKKIITQRCKASVEQREKRPSPTNLGELAAQIRQVVSTEKNSLSSLRALVDTLETVIESEKAILGELRILTQTERKAKLIFDDELATRRFEESSSKLTKSLVDAAQWMETEAAGLSPSKIQREIIVKMNYVQEHCTRAREQIDRSWQDWCNTAREEIRGLIIRYERSSSRYPEIQKARNALEMIPGLLEDSVQKQDDQNTMQHITRMVAAAREKIVSILAAHIGPEATKIYESVVDALAGLQSRSIPKVDLVQRVAGDVALSESELEKCLNSLIELGLLEIRIAL